MPASAAGAAALLIKTTSSKLSVHTPPLLIVQRRVAVVPAATVTALLAELMLVIVAAPLTTVQVPVSPAAAAFAVIVKLLTPHWSLSTPALATVSGVVFVIVTLAFVLAQEPLVIVHCKVALVPTGTPVTVVVGELRLVIVAVPDVTVHVPVPGEAAFAAITNKPLLH